MWAGALALAALVQAGVYHIGMVLALELIGVVATAALMPAIFSIVAELLPAEQLNEGLALQKSAQALGRLLGPAIGMLVPLKVQALGLSGAWLGACEAGLSACASPRSRWQGRHTACWPFHRTTARA